jgi:hypothetical protein
MVFIRKLIDYMGKIHPSLVERAFGGFMDKSGKLSYRK